MLRLTFIAFALLAGLTAQAPSQAAPASDNETRKITIAVMGDSIADGIWGGMVRILIRDRRYTILREAKNSSGFTTSDWQATLDAVIEKKPDAIVVLFGTNDRQSLIVRDKPRSLFRSKDWEAGYIKRVDDFMDKVTGVGIPLVWVGLPVMRDDKWNEESLYLNAIYKKEAEVRGVVFLGTWDLTAVDGKYAPYGLDLKGDKRLLRANDGIHFTESGYEMIADAVLRTLRDKFPATFASPPARDERPKGLPAPEAGGPTSIVPTRRDPDKAETDKPEAAK